MSDETTGMIGRSDALTWLEEHGDALYRYALRRLGSAELAEDLVQETFLAALAGRDRFAGQSQVRTWLIGILKHKVLDHFRKSARERPWADWDEVAPELTGVFKADGHWKIRISAWVDDPQALLENAEFREVLRRCLGKLPRRLAELFWLREAEQMPTEEICKAMPISPTNLWTLLHRARMRLRECLSANWFREDR